MIGFDRFLGVLGRSTFSVNLGIIWELNVRNCQDFGDCYGTRKPRKKREINGSGPDFITSGLPLLTGA